MTKAEMPESLRSGRCDPVTGDAPHHHEPATPAMPMRMVPMTASSTVVDNSHYLPLSPPSTPSTSPPEEASAAMRSDRQVRLREALLSMAQHDQLELPETPESTPLTMSPADVVTHHQPQISARDFVSSVLPATRRRYLIEDAGMELVCPGWTGAVLVDTLARDSTARAASSFSSARLSHSSSSSSSRTLPTPRRTLLTRIAATHDAKDLRSSILDALDHATEKLVVDNVIFVLDRSGMDDDKFRAMVHGLCYVGASIVGRGAHGGGSSSSSSRLPAHSDSEEDLHAPRHVAPGLVLLSVDV